MNQDHNKAKAERKAKEPRKDPQEAKRKAAESHIRRVAEEAGADLPPNPAQDQTPVAQDPTPTPSGDQTPVSGDQTPAPEVKAKKAKKISETVVKWRAQKAFGEDQIITLKVEGNPKRQDAARRFALYENGMTVKAYITKAGANQITPSLAMADIRWDFVSDFINVE